MPYGIVKTARKNLAEATRPLTGDGLHDRAIMAELSAGKAQSGATAGPQAPTIGEVLQSSA